MEFWLSCNMNYRKKKNDGNTLKLIPMRNKAYNCYNILRTGILQSSTLQMLLNVTVNIQCTKSVQIPSFFWSVFSRVWTEYRYFQSRYPFPDWIRRFTKNSIRIRENADQNYIFGHFYAVIPVLFSFGGRRTLVKYHLYNSLWFSPDRLLPYSMNASISSLDNPVSIAISSTAIWLLSRNCRMFLVTTSKSSLKFNKFNK